MCLSIPHKIIFIKGTKAKVECGKKMHTLDIRLVPKVKVGDLVLVPSGTEHNFVNTGDKPLKLFTTYSPAHHPDGTIHETKDDADKADY